LVETAVKAVCREIARQLRIGGATAEGDLHTELVAGQTLDLMNSHIQFLNRSKLLHRLLIGIGEPAGQTIVAGA
jgi:hypothetical protein